MAAYQERVVAVAATTMTVELVVVVVVAYSQPGWKQGWTIDASSAGVLLVSGIKTRFLCQRWTGPDSDPASWWPRTCNVHLDAAGTRRVWDVTLLREVRPFMGSQLNGVTRPDAPMEIR
ncbi:hypothetical protein LZ30DRAFT_341335 [Colletotrichum cereale]|nr:hypothetical protein LZ30DRAFT_341335 [Colletotrichum cereale]